MYSSACLNGFDRTSDGLGRFPCAACSAGPQVLVDYGHRVLQNLGRAVAVLVLCQLRLMKAKLAQQAFAQIAAAYAGRIELLDDLQRFLQIRGGEVRLVSDAGAKRRVRRGSDSGSSDFLNSRRTMLPLGAAGAEAWPSHVGTSVDDCIDVAASLQSFTGRSSAAAVSGSLGTGLGNAQRLRPH